MPHDPVGTPAIRQATYTQMVRGQHKEYLALAIPPVKDTPPSPKTPIGPQESPRQGAPISPRNYIGVCRYAKEVPILSPHCIGTWTLRIPLVTWLPG